MRIFGRRMLYSLLVWEVLLASGNMTTLCISQDNNTESDRVCLTELLGSSEVTASTRGETEWWSSAQNHSTANFTDTDGREGNTSHFGTVKCDTIAADQNKNITDQKLLDDEYISNVRFVYQLILLPTVAIPGCVCNLLNVYVLTRPNKVSANTRLLIALSVADLLFLILNLQTWVMYLLERFNYPAYVQVVTGLRMKWSSSFALLVSGRTSNVLIVVLSVERFIAVRFPFSARTSPLGLYPVQIVLAVCVFVTGLLLPNLFRREIIEVADPVSNITSHMQVWSDFAKANGQFYTIYTYVILVVLRLAPVILVVLLNTVIIITLKSSSAKRAANQHGASNRQAREVKVTRILIAVSLIFLVCVTPGLVHSLLDNFLPGYHVGGHSSRQWIALFYVFPLLDIINSTANFFVYAFMIKTFRDTFLSLIHICRRNNQSVDTATVYRVEVNPPNS